MCSLLLQVRRTTGSNSAMRVAFSATACLESTLINRSSMHNFKNTHSLITATMTSQGTIERMLWSRYSSQNPTTGSTIPTIMNLRRSSSDRKQIIV